MWDGIIFFPLVKDGPVLPMLKQIRKEALRHLSLALTESTSTHHGGHLDTSGSLHSVRNLPDWDYWTSALMKTQPIAPQLRPIYLTRHRPPFTGRSRIRIIAYVLHSDTGVNSLTPENRGSAASDRYETGTRDHADVKQLGWSLTDRREGPGARGPLSLVPRSAHCHISSEWRPARLPGPLTRSLMSSHSQFMTSRVQRILLWHGAKLHAATWLVGAGLVGRWGDDEEGM